MVLTSDEEKLEAHGNDFYYDAKNSTAILKGTPEMWALKEGNLLHALEMSIQDHKADPKIPGAKGFQKAVAKGPGWIDIKEKDKKQQKPVRASWKDQLISNREDNMDVLTLVGDAKFLDPGHDQQLSGDSIKVWLKSPEAQKLENSKESNPAPSPSMGKRLHRVEAIGNVSADSKDLIIRDSGRLAVWFKNMQVENAIPTSNPLQDGTKVGATNAINPTPQEKAPINPIPNNLSLNQGKANNQTDNKKPRPIHLNARSIEAWVQQVNNKNKVEKLWTEGSVSVKQDSEKPGEKGVDVKGDTLQLTAHPEGNFLVVTGDLAQLRMDHMFIVGPEVNIDQSTNKAWVNGVGAMQMESTTNFQGNKLGKAVPLEVHWNKSMFFNGKFAEFHGGIQAEQENSRLACQSLQVFFDKAVSLKGGNNREKTDSPARVQNLVCDRTVRVEEIIRENDKIQKYHRIQAVTLSMNKLDKDEEDTKPGGDGNEVRASGPGEVRILQKSGTETFLSPNGNEGSQPAGKSPTKDPDGEMKLTQVSFLRSMYGNSKTNTATFLENVRVLNFPCENPNIDIDLESVMDNLPKGGMFLRADRLDVLSKQDSKGKSQQEMRAKGRVLVHAQEFWGRAEQVSYEEAKDLVIFHGGDTGVATLYKRVRQGAPPEEIKGKKITYNRSSGQFKIDEGRWLNGGSN
ncbi:MAG: LptA/OstA family protein [Planctomycetia bacterium]